MDEQDRAGRRASRSDGDTEGRRQSRESDIDREEPETSERDLNASIQETGMTGATFAKSGREKGSRR
eukprot:5193664-Pleurochrysis_carterae.AAC.1